MPYVEVSPPQQDVVLTKRGARSRPVARSLYLVLLAIITAAYAAWVLSLPLFPTQDGPMHLYYTHVLHAVLFGPAGIYPRFYAVRHLLPPYASYYYLLMLISRVVPLVVADKIVACIYFVLFAFGFRYLAYSVGRRGGLMALMATPLLLNWSLGMGFVNFNLSMAVALWALGLWCRAAGTPDHGRKIAFVVLAYAAMLTHPVPLLALVSFCVIEVTIRFARHRFQQPSTLPPNLVSDLSYLAIALGTLAYIKLFTTKFATQAATGEPHVGFVTAVLQDTKFYLLQRSLSYFGGHTLADFTIRITLMLLLLAPLALAVHQRLRNHREHRWTLGDTWLGVSIVLLVLLPLLPNEVNNAHYFAARLVIFAWLAAMAAASASTWRPRLTFVSPGLAVAALLLIVNVVTLTSAEHRIRPIAKDLARMEATPGGPDGQVGVLLNGPGYLRPPTLSFDPYFWAGATFFRRTDSVLLNSPWLVFSVMPLKATSLLPTNRVSPSVMELPDKFGDFLDSGEDSRALILPNVSFAIVNRGASTDVPSTPAGLAKDSAAPGAWICAAKDWYSVCDREHAAARGAYNAGKTMPAGD